MIGVFSAGQSVMDSVLESVREFHSTYRGERYWDQPRETTGPVDPMPGHHWRCAQRLGITYDSGGKRREKCTCEGERSKDAGEKRLFG